MTKHAATPVTNPITPTATVCSTCGAPVAKVNADAAATGYKHYVSSAAYKARVLAALGR